MSVKVQCARRAKSSAQQFSVCVPVAMAQSVGLSQGEEVEWQISDRNHLVLCRREPVTAPKPARGKKSKQVYSMSFGDFLRILGV